MAQKSNGIVLTITLFLKNVLNGNHEDKQKFLFILFYLKVIALSSDLII